MVDNNLTMVDKLLNLEQDILSQIPDSIRAKIIELGQRSLKPKDMKEIILQLCSWKELSNTELAKILSRNDKYLKNNYLKPLVKERKIAYTIPEMITHPYQKYKVVSENLEDKQK